MARISATIAEIVIITTVAIGGAAMPVATVATVAAVLLHSTETPGGRELMH